MNYSEKINSLKEELVNETQDLLRIKSVLSEEKPGMPFGEGIDNALKHALKLGERLGFTTKYMDGYAGYIEWGSSSEMVGVLGHLDVVPEGDGWLYPPYGAEIHDGKIYARGSLDDKGPMMAAIYAMYSLKESGYVPNRRIRIILGTNEETGSADMEYYKEHEEQPTIGFTPDADFPVIFGEKGLTVFNLVKKVEAGLEPIVYIKGGQRPNMVPDYCELALKIQGIDECTKKIDSFNAENNANIKYEIENDTLIIKSYGVSAHGSTPELGKNAIMQAIILLDYMNILKGDLKNSVEFLAKNIGMEYNGEGFGIKLHDEDSGYLTFNVGTISTERDTISLGLNLRYPVTFKLENMMNPLEEKIKPQGFKIENFSHQEPLYFPRDHKLIRTLLDVYERHMGEKAEPIAIGGGTYAKEMANMVAFGPIFPGKPDLDHQANEYIEIEDLMKMTNIYASAIMELSK